MADKKTKGKQKIEIKKISNEDDRMITFSKRRSGIYQKINELISMCNTEVGFLVFSKAGTPFSFAHPSIEAIANRFNSPNHQLPKDNAELLTEAYKKERINQFNEEYERLTDALRSEREKEKTLEKSTEEKGLNKCWWKAPIEELGLDDLRRMHDLFAELHDTLCERVIEHARQLGEGPSSSRGNGSGGNGS